jgi:3-methyladenine DNA glycosylase AlkD
MGPIMTRHERLARQLLHEFEAMGNPANVAGMARYGIRSARVLGITAPVIRARAKALGRDHELAAALWGTGVLEIRLLAALVDDPARVTDPQMEAWVREFDSWALCDGACCVLFDRTPFAVAKARAWTCREEEYVKRAGFVVMAGLATHDTSAPDRLFLSFLPLIEQGASDGRNFVKKGVNWALRGIGKRNLALNAAAVEVCQRLAAREEACARWVGRNALAELTSEKTLARIRNARSPRPAPARIRSRQRPSAGTRAQTNRRRS